MKRYAPKHEPNIQNVPGSPADELAKILEAGGCVYEEELTALRRRVHKSRAADPENLSDEEQAIFALFEAKD